MQRTLREHIDYLEQKIEALKKLLDDPNNTFHELDQIGIDIGIAERSLLHFRKAYELEMRVSQAVTNFKSKASE